MKNLFLLVIPFLFFSCLSGEKAKEAGVKLISVIKDGNTDEARKMIGDGAVVNSADETGYTPLLAAAEKGNTIVVKLLLSKKADFDAVNKDNLTALRLAAKNGFKDVVEILKNAGVDLTTVKPFEAALKRTDELVAEMEKLAAKLKKEGRI